MKNSRYTVKIVLDAHKNIYPELIVGATFTVVTWSPAGDIVILKMDSGTEYDIVSSLCCLYNRNNIKLYLEVDV